MDDASPPSAEMTCHMRIGWVPNQRRHCQTPRGDGSRYYDELPTEGGPHGQAFRDVALEEQVHKLTQDLGIGAQFGGKYFCHDVRVVRLPRHGASCPVGLGVSCSADRQVYNSGL